MATTARKRARKTATSRPAKSTRSARTTTRRKAAKPAARAKRSAQPARRSATRTASRNGKPRAAGLRVAAPRARASRRSAAATPSAKVTDGIGLLNYHIDYTSQDLDGVKRFYTEGLGFKTFHHDKSVNYVMIRTTPTSSIGFMPPMPGPPEEWRPPGEPALYFMVEDVDQAYRELQARGVQFEQPPQDMPWMHRVALLRDPEGRRVCLAQVLR